jgi:hypothetical protein
MKKRKKIIIITEKQAKILVSNIITEAQNAYSMQTEPPFIDNNLTFRQK